jgi:hypothetical protein
MSEMSEMSKMS